MKDRSKHDIAQGRTTHILQVRYISQESLDAALSATHHTTNSLVPLTCKVLKLVMSLTIDTLPLIVKNALICNNNFNLYSSHMYSVYC